MRNIRLLFLPLIASSLLAAIACQAQDNTSKQDNTQKPATKLEGFQVKTGIVLVRAFTTVGKLHGLGGDVTVDARDFRDAANPSTHVSGISISVKETDRLERENTSFIDADEIDSLLKGLDYISKATKAITTLDHFEVEYQTKGDFGVTVFNESNGSLAVAVSSGRIGKTTSYLKLQNIIELESLITSAKAKISGLQ